MPIRLEKGDITKIEVDAIVNAANESLLGGGGVDGAIHNAAGPDLVKECSTLGGCKTGEAKITKGYRLPAKHVIHTVGPKYWQYKEMQAQGLLMNCYLNSLNLAKDNNLHSIAFPGISTGIFGYPKQAAAKVATSVVSNWLKEHEDYDLEVVFVAFDDETYQIYLELLEDLN